ncbi:hypothetical protein D1F64_11495 [Breoghania sp. L-A4]|nr:hypothetical protein D1F64_11495 [Breoghania sp. L-A4]
MSGEAPSGKHCVRRPSFETGLVALLRMRIIVLIFQRISNLDLILRKPRSGCLEGWAACSARGRACSVKAGQEDAAPISRRDPECDAEPGGSGTGAPNLRGSIARCSASGLTVAADCCGVAPTPIVTPGLPRGPLHRSARDDVFVHDHASAWTRERLNERRTE